MTEQYPIGWRMQTGMCMPKPGWEIEATDGRQSIRINVDCTKTDPCRHKVQYADGTTAVLTSTAIRKDCNEQGLEVPDHFER